MLCINQLYMLIQLEKGQILSGCKQHEKPLLEDVTGCKSYEEDVISYHIHFLKTFSCKGHLNIKINFVGDNNTHIQYILNIYMIYFRVKF